MDHVNVNGSVGRRVHRSAEQWAELIDAQRRSGLSIVAFCRERGLAVSSFHRWRRRLETMPTDSRSADRSFVRLRVSAGDAPVGSSSSAVVRFIDGVELRVGVERLAELVTLLRGGLAASSPPNGATDRGSP